MDVGTIVFSTWPIAFEHVPHFDLHMFILENDISKIRDFFLSSKTLYT